MRPAHVRERPYGMRYYASSTPGIGGRLRTQPADFRVVERRGVEPAPTDADPGDYPYLLLEATLTDWDTHKFVATLADRLGIHPERIAWAGTKDARAVSTQLVSVRGIHPDELVALPDVELVVIGRYGRQLEFGDHAGNRFEIVVRGAQHHDRIDRIHGELRGDGDRAAVPNWFGPQRFGVRRPVTHRVGLAILRGDFRDAVLTYLTASTPHEPERTREARRRMAAVAEGEGSWDDARERLPGYLHHERTLLEVLAAAGTADDATARDALEALPWALRRLFVHAVQSYIFNEVVSERLRRALPFDEPVVGDLIGFVDGDAVDVDRPQRVSATRLTAARRHVDRGRAVVLGPLVGHEVPLPQGEPGRILRAVLEWLDLTPDDFAGEAPFDETGSTRPIRLETAISVSGDPPRFTFDLPPGAYATVVVREFCKGDPLAMA